MGVQEFAESPKNRRKCCRNQPRKNRGLAEVFRSVPERSLEVRGDHREDSDTCQRLIEIATRSGACWESTKKNPRVYRKFVESPLESSPEGNSMLPVKNLLRTMS